MKKIIALTGILTVLLSSINAQYDPKAKELLGKVSAKYSALNSYSVDFKHTLHSPLAGIDEEAKGSAIISGEKFRLQLDGQLVIVDGKTMWTYLKEDNEVNISDFDPDDNEMNPSYIYKMWEKGYKYQMAESETIAGKKYDVVELNPINTDDQFFKVKIWINPTDYTIKKWQMFEKNGNRYAYEISLFQANVAITASTFSFDKSKYPGVHEEDLR